ncbi:MAG: hypothetical protein C6I00_07255 [Nitratiruptor sp.]|nr:hypothetical protein [Nitratiruptor sp.]NPA83832.1 peptidyl-prolyl cis-trans isomerase [Campylobacterota bacterium]
MKILAIVLLLWSLAPAKVIDALAAIVNGEPITTYEIQQIASRLHISPQEALELLIRKKIEESQIQKLGIDVDEFELEEAIDAFAREKGMDLLALRQAIESQGIDWQTYKTRFKERLLRQKLYEAIIQQLGKNITPKQLENYYNNHKEEFTIARRAKVLKYISPSKELLEQIRANPLYRPENPALLAMGEEELDLQQVNPAFANLINNTPEGGFTPIIPLPNDNRYLLLLVQSKSDKRTLPFEQVQPFILTKLLAQDRERRVKEYFDKLRASAKVTILRMPKGE